jgi:uncharacterized protein (TIGR03086 family)
MASIDPPRDVAGLLAAGRDREAAREGAARRPDRQEGPQMEPIEQLDALGPHLGGVVAAITPDQLDLPTPCDQFTVRGVLEHLIGGATAFAAAFRGEAPTEPAVDDPLAAFGPALGDLVAAITAPGALERTVQTPFGALPGATFARFVVLDGMVHGWDLATATGQGYEPPAALVAEASEFARGVLDGLRDGQTFRDAVEPAPDAGAMEALANFTGRRSR